MSVVAESGLRTFRQRRVPSAWGLAWPVFAGEFQAAVVLWAIAIPVALLTLAPLGGPQEWLWLPWRIDGAWALIGGVGWGYLVCAVVAWFVGGSIERRGFDRPAAGWLRIAIAISGYGAMALGHTGGARVLCAVVLGAIVVRVLGFASDGNARTWPWSPGSGVRFLAALSATLIGFSYGVTHAFAADGSGGSYVSQATYVRPGQTETIDVGLSHVLFGVEVQSATVTGPHAANASVRSMVLHLGSPLELTTPAMLRSLPKAFRSSLALTSTKLPYRVPAGQDLWISVRVALRSCSAATLDTLRLRYTILGMPTAASVRIGSPLTLDCSH